MNANLAPEDIEGVQTLKKGRVQLSSRAPYLNNCTNFIVWLERNHSHLLTEHTPAVGAAEGRDLKAAKRNIKEFLMKV